jgi:hypothetical protein
MKNWAWCNECHTRLGPEGEACNQCGNIFTQPEKMPDPYNDTALMLTLVGVAVLVAVILLVLTA